MRLFYTTSHKFCQAENCGLMTSDNFSLYQKARIDVKGKNLFLPWKLGEYTLAGGNVKDLLAASKVYIFSSSI